MYKYFPLITDDFCHECDAVSEMLTYVGSFIIADLNDFIFELIGKHWLKTISYS